jgi:hypothetical protein
MQHNRHLFVMGDGQAVLKLEAQVVVRTACDSVFGLVVFARFWSERRPWCGECRLVVTFWTSFAPAVQGMFWRVTQPCSFLCQVFCIMEFHKISHLSCAAKRPELSTLGVAFDCL